MDIKLVTAILKSPLYIPILAIYGAKKKMGGGKILKDIEANYFGRPYASWIKFLILMAHNQMFRNVFYYRVGNVKHLVSWLCPEAETFTISTSMTAGAGFKACHPFATVVNAESVGENFSVFQNVTVGMSNGGKPTIGDNVIIYSHAVVIGPIKIGNNVSIGAGSVVCKDIPHNCVVVGNPARIVKQEGKKTKG